MILDDAPVVEALRREAADWLAQPFDVPQGELTMRRYLAADAYDNAQDIAERKPGGGRAHSQWGSGRYAALCVSGRGRRLPREKAFLDELARLDPELGGLAQELLFARRRAALPWQSGSRSAPSA